MNIESGRIVPVLSNGLAAAHMERVALAAKETGPVLALHVVNVVGMRARAQVSRVHAPRIVATVENDLAVGDRAMHRFPSQTMGSIVAPLKT